MPYVEGYGTWPFGEEWLWEAIATSYVPLLDLLDAHGDALTLSVTPVLADQLEVADLGARFDRFVTEVRRMTHEADIAAAASPEEADALRYSASAYERAAERMRELEFGAFRIEGAERDEGGSRRAADAGPAID